MARIDLKYAVGLKPEKAIQYLKDKGFAISFDWYEVWQEAHTKAFTVAKALRMDILQDIRTAVQDALDNGLTFQDFRKNLEPTLKAKGWWGKQLLGDGKGGAESVQLGSPWRLRTIYDTNTQTAYMSGRFKSQMENVESRPYFQYVAVMDARTRPAHAALNGRVFRYDDEFWNSFYPPNGWRCRCRVRSLDGQNLQERKLTVESSAGKLGSREELVSKRTGELQPVTTFTATDRITGKTITVAPDVGWSYNPGMTDWKPDLDKYDPEIRRLWN